MSSSSPGLHSVAASTEVDSTPNESPVEKSPVRSPAFPSELRAKARQALKTTKFHVCVISLVVFDCLLVIGELLIDLDAFSVKAHAAESGRNGTADAAVAANGGRGAAEQSDSSEALAAAARALHFCSIGILSVFMIEIAVKLVAFGREFFHHKLEVADALIVVVSFSLDVAFADDEEAASAVGLLVALRLWRVARIVNGIVMSVKSQAKTQVGKERSLRCEAQKELTQFAEFCAAQEREIDALRALLEQHGIAVPEIEKPPIPRSSVNAAAEANMYLAMPAFSDGRESEDGGVT